MKNLPTFLSLVSLGLMTAQLSFAQNSGPIRQISVTSLQDYNSSYFQGGKLICLNLDNEFKKEGRSRGEVNNVHILFNAQSDPFAGENKIYLVDPQNQPLPILPSSPITEYFSEDYSMDLSHFTKDGIPEVFSTFFEPKAALKDICLRPAKNLRLKNVRISFMDKVAQTLPFPPLNAVGSFGSIRDGVVYGWACEKNSHSNTPALKVNLKISIAGNYTETVLTKIASENINSSGGIFSYGNPFQHCTNTSGFSFQIPKEKFANKDLRLALIAVGPQNQEQVLVPTLNYKMPVVFDRPGIFKSGNQFFLLNENLREFCSTDDPDQYLAAQTSKAYYDYGDIGPFPTQLKLTSKGPCEIMAYPVGFFKAQGSPKIFFSNGSNSYCYVQNEGMWEHLFHNQNKQGKFLIKKEEVVYRKIPNVKVQIPFETGIPSNPYNVCRPAGQFRINGGKEVYETNGYEYCHLHYPSSIRNPVFNYRSPHSDKDALPLAQIENPKLCESK